ncbi:MAG: hypothetical protein JXQ99_23315 [Hyphomicrobiaceae bacterium]
MHLKPLQVWQTARRSGDEPVSDHNGHKQANAKADALAELTEITRIFHYVCVGASRQAWLVIGCKTDGKNHILTSGINYKTSRVGRSGT